MAKNQDGYLSAKESRRISKENRRITDQYEKQRKRRNKDGHYQDVTPLGALVKSATTPAHPEVMPSREQMREYAVHAATLVLNRLLAQADDNSTLNS